MDFLFFYAYPALFPMIFVEIVKYVWKKVNVNTKHLAFFVKSRYNKETIFC